MFPAIIELTTVKLLSLDQLIYIPVPEASLSAVNELFNILVLIMFTSLPSLAQIATPSPE